MSSHKVQILFQFLLVLLATSVAQESGGACRTSEGQDGVCINVKECPEIVKMIQDKRGSLTEEFLQQMRARQCGTFDGATHVCCEFPIVRPSGEITSESIASGVSALNETVCGRSDINRVANGVDADVSEYPWMVLLQYRDELSTNFGCGGTLITSRYVLTAAHCIVVPRKKLVSVRLGEHDLEKETDCRTGRSMYCAPAVQDIAVEEAIYHKDYNNRRVTNDIGLVRLAREATINSGVKPICLPVTPTSKAAEVSRLIISGWGRVETGERANVLQKAVVTPIENAECSGIFKPLVITENQMCARGDNEVDACKGDSGGPAFYPVRYMKGVRFVQYGVVSAGVIKCGSTYPGIYVRVLNYLDWIAGNIKA